MSTFVRKSYTEEKISGINILKSKFVWNINNFCELIEDPKDILTSPRFKMDESKETYSLMFMPTGNLKDPVSKHKSATLTCHNNYDEEFACSCKVWFFTDNECVLTLASDKSSFKPSVQASIGLRPVYILPNPEEVVSYKNVMTIHCEITVEKPIRWKSNKLFMNDEKLRAECKRFHNVLLASGSSPLLVPLLYYKEMINIQLNEQRLI
ncbi:hypothetical protein TKK_0019119 [Trichogramma kaykai]